MSGTKRVILKYRPTFAGPIEGYVVNFLKRNLWRVEATMEYQDVMQEAYLVFMRTAERYPGVEARHFMSLFKTAWSNAFIDLTNYDSKLRTIPTLGSIEGEDDDAGALEVVGESDNAGFVVMAIEQAPKEVKEVLRLFAVAPVEILELMQAAWRGQGKNVANGNHMINQALGRPFGTDSVGQVQRYFS